MNISGNITYRGKTSITLNVSDGDHCLNGDPMIHGKEYILNDGDVIEDMNFKPLSPKDLVWKFSDKKEDK